MSVAFLVACGDDAGGGKELSPGEVTFSHLEGIWLAEEASQSVTLHFTRVEEALDLYGTEIVNAARIRELLPAQEPVLAVSRPGGVPYFHFQSLWRLKVWGGALELELLTGEHAAHVTVPIAMMWGRGVLGLGEASCQLCPLALPAEFVWRSAQPTAMSETGWVVRQGTASGYRTEGLFLGGTWTGAGDLVLFSDRFGLGGAQDASWRGEFFPAQGQVTRLYAGPEAGRMAQFMPWGDDGVQWVGLRQEGLLTVGRLAPGMEAPHEVALAFPAKDLLEVRRRSDDEAVVLVGDPAYEGIGAWEPLGNISRYRVLGGEALQEEPLPPLPDGTLQKATLSPSGRAAISVAVAGAEGHLEQEVLVFVEEAGQWKRVSLGGLRGGDLVRWALRDDGALYALVTEGELGLVPPERADFGLLYLVRFVDGGIAQRWLLPIGHEALHLELSPEGLPWVFAYDDGYVAASLDEDDVLRVQAVAGRESKNPALDQLLGAPIYLGTHIKATRHTRFGPGGGAVLFNGYDGYLMLPPEEQRVVTKRSIKVEVGGAPEGAQLVVEGTEERCIAGCELTEAVGAVHFFTAEVPRGWLLTAKGRCEGDGGLVDCELGQECGPLALDRGFCKVSNRDYNLTPTAAPGHRSYGALREVSFGFERTPVLGGSDVPLGGRSFIASADGAGGRFAALMWVMNGHRYPDGTKAEGRGGLLNAPVLTVWRDGEFEAAWAVPPEMVPEALQWVGGELHLLHDGGVQRFDGGSLEVVGGWEQVWGNEARVLGEDGRVWTLEELGGGEARLRRYDVQGSVLFERVLALDFQSPILGLGPGGSALVAPSVLQSPLDGLTFLKVSSDGEVGTVTLPLRASAPALSLKLGQRAGEFWVEVRGSGVSESQGFQVNGEVIVPVGGGATVVLVLGEGAEAAAVIPCGAPFAEVGGVSQDPGDGSWVVWGRGGQLGTALVWRRGEVIELIQGQHHSSLGVFGFAIHALYFDVGGRLFMSGYAFDRSHIIRPALLRGGAFLLELDAGMLSELPKYTMDASELLYLGGPH